MKTFEELMSTIWMKNVNKTLEQSGVMVSEDMMTDVLEDEPLERTTEIELVQEVETVIGKVSLVQEIHNSFYGAVELIKKENSEMDSLDTQMQTLIDKAHKLRELGFSETKEIKMAEQEINRLQGIKRANEKKQVILGAINYFGSKYPNYKLITEESVKAICAKYGLIYGDVSKYIGTVPNKNLQEIQEFKIKEEDKLYSSFYRAPENPWDIGECVSNKLGAEKYIKYKVENPYYRTHLAECSLQIVAPKEEFNHKDMELKGFKLTVKPPEEDPIVLCPVYYKGLEGTLFLVVSAWGLEASDEIVVNQRMN